MLGRKLVDESGHSMSTWRWRYEFHIEDVIWVLICIIEFIKRAEEGDKMRGSDRFSPTSFNQNWNARFYLLCMYVSKVAFYEQSSSERPDCAI